MFKNITTLIFDLDGVITSERKYWDTSRLTTWEIFSQDNYLGIKHYFGQDDIVVDQLSGRSKTIISSDFIYEVKRRAVNSNWDLTFFVVGLHLVSLLHDLKQTQSEQWVKAINLNTTGLEDRLRDLGKLFQGQAYTFKTSASLIEQFWKETESLTGNAVVEYLSVFSRKVLDAELPYLEPKGELWQLCYHNFQAWYEGKRGHSLPDDDTVLELSKIQDLLSMLHESKKYSLGIATGRPRAEVLQPLSVLGLLQYFDASRIVTYDDVLEAEALVSTFGNDVRLAKPHPFVLLKAIHPNEDIQVLCTEEFQALERRDVAYIGDAASDVVAAIKAGCLSIGVMTGCIDARGIPSQKKMFLDNGCHAILNSVLELPTLLAGESA